MTLSDGERAYFAAHVGQTPEAYAAGGWSFDGLCSDLRRRGHEPDQSLAYALAGMLDNFPETGSGYVCALCASPAAVVSDHPAGPLWYCPTCGTGDYIIPEADFYEDSAPDRGAAIAAARQIDNVLASLLDLVDGPAFPDRMGQIRATARQLYDLWQVYQVGALEPLPADGLAF